jgi:hypothetical protein
MPHAFPNRLSTTAFFRRLAVFSLVTIAICFWLSPRPLFANDMDKGESTSIRTTVVFTAWGPEIAGLGLIHQGKIEPIFVPSGSRSDPVNYRGPAEIILVRRDNSTSSWQPGLPISPVAKIRIHPAQRKVLLILSPSPKASGNYEVQVVEDDLDKFPPQSVAIFNLTPARIAIRVGETQFEVAPGGRHISKIQLPDQKTRLRFSVAAWQEQRNTWKLVRSSGINMSAHSRVMAFITTNSDHSFYDILRLDDDVSTSPVLSAEGQAPAPTS